jgi:aryl-alcohol dehydrogenase-like predicted oxidoreductase
VNRLLDCRVNAIDTATVYGGSEEALGAAVGHRRHEYVLISKCGQSFEDLPGEAWSAELISATVDRALRRLKTDHLNVMLLHSCSLDALGALVRARDAGKIQFLGYSGDNEVAAFAATLSEVSVIETSINICDHANIEQVLPVTREHNVGVIAKRPIANTAWRPLEKLPGFYQGYARTYHERFESMGLQAEDLGFQADDWPEIALRFTLSQPGVTVAIIGTTNPDNALRNVEAAEKGPLPVEIVQRIRAAFDRAQKQSGQSWSAQT